MTQRYEFAKDQYDSKPWKIRPRTRLILFNSFLWSLSIRFTLTAPQDPHLRDAHFNLSRLHERAKRPQKALRHLLAYRRHVRQ